jgi:ferric-dicitrate binding protein FerR (iron transport regulator)
MSNRKEKGMRESSSAAILCSLLLAFQPTLGPAAPRAFGILNGKGPVRVNGIVAPTGTAIYPGNRIDTGPEATAFVILPHGAKFVLGASTSVRTAPGNRRRCLRLEKGTIGAVSTPKDSLVVETRGVTIRSRSATGTYVVAVQGNSLQVFARHGAALARASNRAVAIGKGMLMKATVAPPPAGSKSGHLKTVLLAVGAAAAAGLAMAVRNLSGSHSQNCVSPSRLSCP